MRNVLCISIVALVLVAGCNNPLDPTFDPDAVEETPHISGGTVPAWLVGTWYSDYNLTRTTITDDAQYSYTYDEANEFKGGLDVDEAGETIHYAETYYWDDGEWKYDEDPYHVRATYLVSGGNVYTEAFFQDMQVYKRTAGTSGSLAGTWEYNFKMWYGDEGNPSYVDERKTVLTLNGDGTYTRKMFRFGEEIESSSGNYTYGDINPEELYLSATADIEKAWVMEGDYLVTAPRFYTQTEVAMIKE